MTGPMEFRIAELERRLDNLLRIGTVAAADYAAARVRVQSGDLLTGWIPWLTRRASNDIDWWAPEVGEQVALLSPCGDPAQAVCLPAVYQAAHPAPQNRATVQHVRFADGTTITYDRAASVMTVHCVGDVALTADGSVTAAVAGDVTATVGGQAALDVSGPATVTSATRIDLAAPGINLNSLSGGATDGRMTGSFTLIGDLDVTGDITATGTVIDGGGNTNHHSHS